MKRGDIYDTKDGKLEIRVVCSADEVVCRFIDTDSFDVFSKSNIISGRVKNRNKPSVAGVGYLGYGPYKSAENGKLTTHYMRWNGMLSRCYSPTSPAYPVYGGNGVTVCKEWHNFQNFAKWYDEYKYKEDGWHIDKDLLKKGNKVYCPEFCCIIPRQINQALVSRTALRGEHAIGVTLDKESNRYICQLNIGVMGNLPRKSYKTEIEAYGEYKTAKETYLVSLAYEWRGRVHPKVLRALCDYEIEWTD